MFGVSKESKAYRLYDPTTKKIIISKDVRFDEEKMWNWEEKPDDDEVLKDIAEIEEETEAVGTEAVGREEPLETRGEEEEVAEADQTGEQVVTNEETRAVGSNRAGRNIQRPTWMKDYVCEGLSMIIEEGEAELMALFIGEDDPEKFEEAIKEEKWRKAMEAEIKSINDNNTWELVDLPDGAKVIG
uniref:Retroviral polymerase SH3-like domain-containing protein n=1 Tax=Brassica oleracea var. oleracea TaxID=109376 RepID=A0A0D2ZYS7_BRAOL